MIQAIVGANWGDEGKGKLTDVLAEKADVVVRFQGGANAGHTIINDMGKFALHLLPSGVFRPHVKNILGTGVALDIEKLVAELEGILARGVAMPQLFVSDRAQVLMDFHILMDTLEEERLSSQKFGSTKSGIAPFYADKYAKVGVQVCQLFDKDLLHQRLQQNLVKKNVLLTHLYGKEPLDADQLTEKYYALGQKLKPMVTDTRALLTEALREGKQVLLEGQLGALRDPDYGIYPYTTSSSPLAGYAPLGAGVPPYRLSQIIAVTKAYSSSVGTGYFPSKLTGPEADELRKRGGDAGEFGATTGRPRDVGWFDAVATRYGCRCQSATELALTNLDVLGYLDEIKVCVAYKVDGETVNEFPVTPLLARAEPVYETLPGWKQEVRGIRHFSDLPAKCQDYVRYIENQVGIPIRLLSNGPKRDEIIYREA